MNVRLINIGFGNSVSAGRVIAMVGPDSAPVKRIVQEAKESGRLIDATCGRRTRAVIIADSDHVILSALSTEAIMGRLDAKEKAPQEKAQEY